MEKMLENQRYFLQTRTPYFPTDKLRRFAAETATEFASIALVEERTLDILLNDVNDDPTDAQRFIELLSDLKPEDYDINSLVDNYIRKKQIDAPPQSSKREEVKEKVSSFLEGIRYFQASTRSTVLQHPYSFRNGRKCTVSLRDSFYMCKNIFH